MGTVPAIGIVLLGGLIGPVALPRAGSGERIEVVQVIDSASTSLLATAPQAVARRNNRTQAARPRTVGPGARNWTTGQKLGLHKPWLRARN